MVHPVTIGIVLRVC